MLLYLHHRDSKIFFHPAKFDNFKDEKISAFKTVSVSKSKNWWSSEQLLRGIFFMFGGGQKEFELFFKITSALKSCIK